MLHQAGGHFLQVSGPNKIPDCVLGDIAALCGPDFATPASKAIELLEAVRKATDLIVIQPSSGSYARGAALTSARPSSNGTPTFVSKHIAPRSLRVAELMPAAARLGVEAGLTVVGLLRRPSDIQSTREPLNRPLGGSGAMMPSDVDRQSRPPAPPNPVVGTVLSDHTREGVNSRPSAPDLASALLNLSMENLPVTP